MPFSIEILSLFEHQKSACSFTVLLFAFFIFCLFDCDRLLLLLFLLDSLLCSVCCWAFCWSVKLQITFDCHSALLAEMSLVFGGVALYVAKISFSLCSVVVACLAVVNITLCRSVSANSRNNFSRSFRFCFSCASLARVFAARCVFDQSRGHGDVSLTSIQYTCTWILFVQMYMYISSARVLFIWAHIFHFNATNGIYLS